MNKKHEQLGRPRRGVNRLGQKKSKYVYEIRFIQTAGWLTHSKRSHHNRTKDTDYYDSDQIIDDIEWEKYLQSSWSDAYFNPYGGWV